ncbi:ran protein binding protein [Ceraceosorus bombacis]|uniref:Ran protein binding protein n=1 Tax=Ceraceosorus bombacis TaxID=401625 RepID=A0A0P1BDM6_9BASI|nr:ran protein binding protein [Ceraceosorus bombacis]
MNEGSTDDDGSLPTASHCTRAFASHKQRRGIFTAYSQHNIMSSSTAVANGSAGNGAPAGGAAAPASSGTKQTVQPSEVGWLFVPQYYTFLNQNPERLHCFYTKKSTLIHGNELEEVQPCFGQQEIHNKISSLGFEDCKVYVSNVDSQSSISGGIVIQVLGELSNKKGPWRKFAQTFFLAEQPNGYYVLNDIFRFLSEDDDARDDVAPEEADAVAAPNGAVSAAPAEEAAQQSPGDAPIPAPAAAVSEPAGEVEAEGAGAEVGIDSKVATVEAEDAPVQPAGVAAAEAQQEQPEGNAPIEQQTEPEPAETKPAAPSAPKTWANLAAANVKGWGSTASESRGVSTSRTPANVSTPATAAANNARPQAANGARTSGQQPGTSGTSAPQIHGGVFIKNVIMDQMPEEGLQAALEKQFGPMKECQIIASRACAFGEFVSAEQARRAIAMSVRVSEGGQGGVPVGNNGWTVTVEEKRKVGDRPPPTNRGPIRGTGQGGDRGGFRGRGRGGPSRGRGGATAAQSG